MRSALPLSSLALGALLSACAAAPPRAPSAPPLSDGEHACADWTFRHMRVACVDPLGAEAASHRGRHVMLTVRGGRVVRVELRNGAGGREVDDAGDAGFVVEEEPGGHSHRWFDRWGKPTTIVHFVGLTTTRLTAWGAPKRDRPEDGHRRVYTLDARGFVASSKVVDDAGRPARTHGVYEVRTVYDGAGHLLERAFFEPDGRPAVDEAGVHRTRYRYDEHGCQLDWWYFDAAGRPFGGAMGVSHGVRTCDAYGNVLSMRWYDPSGAPQINRQGLHGWIDTLDAHGGLTMRVGIGLDGRPAPTNARETIIRWRRDGFGHVIEASYLGPNAEPFVEPSGFAGVRFVLHDNGETLRKTYLDANGQPVVTRDGHAQELYDYDASGNLRSIDFLDATGGPAHGPSGEASIGLEYDAHELVASRTFYDADDRPMLGRTGYARESYERNDEGAIVVRRHFDAKGNPVEIAAARTMWFSYAGADTSRPSALTREQAERRARDAAQRLAAGEPWKAVGKRLADSADDEPSFGGQSFWYGPLWGALAKLKPGDPAVVLDTPRGFVLLEREE